MTMAKSMRVRRPVKQEAPAFRQGSCHSVAHDAKWGPGALLGPQNAKRIR